MRNQSSISTPRWISLYSILGAWILLALLFVHFIRSQAHFPLGTIIAKVPMGGLDRETSAQRLLGVYMNPVELHYDESIIHLDPAVVGFQLDFESMFAESDHARAHQPSWERFWNYLWGFKTAPAKIPLRASYSETKLRLYLGNEVAPRYDQPPTPAMPLVGTVNFRPAIEGTALDIERSIPLIKNALRSPAHRVVELPLLYTEPPLLSFQNLEIFLKQTIDLAGFDGLTGLYLLDLHTGQEIHFAYKLGKDIPTNQDVAFSAASIIKIPIMVSVLRRIGENPSPETFKLLEEMIEKSGNDPADWAMERVIDQKIAPMLVSADMKALGLENTFLAGQFYPGAPLLALFQTPANQRTDIDTDPDIYNQTSPSDIGKLLEGIYQCSQSGGGTLVTEFPDEITQAECQTMIALLTGNKLGLLIEAGVPDGTRVAHKHGWVSIAGIMNTLGDAGIVYTPGGNYVLVVFLYQPIQLIWEPASTLVADLASAVYNYYNLPSQ